MIEKSICILLPTWDKYVDLCQPCVEFLKRYWSDCPFPVFVGSNKKPCDGENVTTILNGNDKGYGSNLRDYLEKLDYQWVVIWVEDLWLTHQIDSAELLQAIAAFQEKADSIRLRFGYSALGKRNRRHREIPMEKEKPDDPYLVTLSPSLWKTEALIALVNDSDTAWEIEKKGNDRLGSATGCYRVPEHSLASAYSVNAVVKGMSTYNGRRMVRQSSFPSSLSAFPKLKLYREIYMRMWHLVPRSLIAASHQIRKPFSSPVQIMS